MYKICFITTLTIAFFSGCAMHGGSNNEFDSRHIGSVCDDSFFDKTKKKTQNDDDVIYQGLNAGLIARNCSAFQISNDFFDRVEDSYKYDVDLEGLASKAGRLATTLLINDTILDYQGNLYERIMVNAYKGLNYMSLGDYQNARVEFNRALMRQDKAKEYFAKEIAKNRESYEKIQKQEVPKEVQVSLKKGYSDGLIYANSFLKEFQTTKNFINPYATYLSLVFFFMDRDYRKASDLFREVVAVAPKSKELRREKSIFDGYARRTKADNKKYIFVIHEDGLGSIKEEFRFGIPFIVNDNVITINAAFSKLQKREGAYPYLLANGVKTTQISNFDDIIATEYKIELPSMVLKSVSQSILKLLANIYVAKNDATGGYLSLGTAIINNITTRADIRSWRGLPKTASVAMVENKGEIKISTPSGVVIDEKTDSKKNILFFVRTFQLGVKPVVIKISK